MSQMSGFTRACPFNLAEKGCSKFLNSVFIFGWVAKYEQKEFKNVPTDPIPLIQNFCGISVEWDKLIRVLDLYWCASVVAWL